MDHGWRLRLQRKESNGDVTINLNSPFTPLTFSSPASSFSRVQKTNTESGRLATRNGPVLSVRLLPALVLAFGPAARCIISSRFVT